jgi:hypothetical protein
MKLQLASLTSVTLLTAVPSFVGVVAALRVFEFEHSYFTSLVIYGAVRGFAILVVVPIASPIMQRLGAPKGN